MKESAPRLPSIDGVLNDLDQRQAAARIWSRDPSLWKEDSGHQEEIRQRLGWLTLPGEMRRHLPELADFAAEVREAGIHHVVLCGMGGSSLAPEVMRITFGSAAGYPRLWVLDTTDPATIARVRSEAPPLETLYLVSSKSGGTIEVDSLFRYFYGLVESAGVADPGSHFAAVTDPGTGLEDRAREKGFRKIFLNPPDIGGRYSALSLFGLVPAALMGLDVGRLLDSAEEMAQACGPESRGQDNPGLWLGAILGGMAMEGRDKLTLVASSVLSSFGLWVEQLIAESTGKEDKGIVPVAGEPLGEPVKYGQDRFFVYSRVDGEDNASLDQFVAGLNAAGQPGFSLRLADLYDLGGEFFRWEFATAVAGAVMGIDPFDQPNVQESKEITGDLLGQYTGSRILPAAPPEMGDEEMSLYGLRGDSMEAAVKEWLKEAEHGDYIALMAYLEMSEDNDRALAALRRQILEWTGCATTLGYGPRFLHSTGQLHKGGPNKGLFIQLTADDPVALEIPDRAYDFGILKSAQALGDYQALERHGRKVISIHLRSNVVGGLHRLARSM